MRIFIRHIIRNTWKPVLERYLSKERPYQWKGLRLIVRKGVFHPHFFHSTKIMIKYLAGEEFAGKKVLEPGAGSGLISLYAARRGAHVMATDISSNAVECIRYNSLLNALPLTVIQSDLFDDIPAQAFDYIIINPPYYKGNPRKDAEYAWYAGRDYEYFEKLFRQLPAYMHPASKVLMILSDDCDLDKINSIAAQQSYSMEAVYRKRLLLEENVIYQLRKE